MAANPSAVIFDVDGTLVDSVGQHTRAWQDALAEYGAHTTYEDVRRQIGKGADQLLPVFLKTHQIESYGSALAKRRAEIFKTKYLAAVKGFPHVRELFCKIPADGRRIALGSSAKSDELKHYKEIADVADLPMAETTADDVERSKPYPDIFAAALERLACHPWEAIAIGDTPYDAEAATKAGMPSIGLLTGGWRESDLRDAGFMAVFKDTSDLLQRYKSSPLDPHAEA